MTQGERVTVKYKHGSGWITLNGTIRKISGESIMVQVLGIDAATNKLIEVEEMHIIAKADIIYCKPITE